MLQELRIQGIAIIDELHVVFPEGFTVLTGETGAGKSIIVDAVELLVGGRASADLIRTGSEEAVVEGVFEARLPEAELKPFREQGLLAGSDEPMIFRRVLSRSGKNRSYLNGHPVTLSTLQELGRLMVDLHGQHEHQSLLRSESQRQILDRFGGLWPSYEEYRELHGRLQGLLREKGELEEAQRDKTQRFEFLNHQREEIEGAGLKSGEEEELLREKNLLAHAEKLTRLSHDAYGGLYGEDGSVLQKLGLVLNQLSEMAKLDDRVEPMLMLCRNGMVQLKEAAEQLRGYTAQLDFEPGRLNTVEERLFRIEQLKRKYGATIEAVLQTLDRLRGQTETLTGLEQRLELLTKETEEVENRRLECGRRLSQGRDKAARTLKKKVQAELAALRMDRAVFEVELVRFPQAGPAGMEEVRFLIAANPGEEPKPLQRVASGGELSRIMLALKTVFTELDPVPVLIFDEVDAGIGGAVADAVGRRLRLLAGKRQVFCITHLAQIASLAASHYHVEKVAQSGRSVTRVRRLDHPQRVDEISRMLGGETITAATRRHAREMLDLAGGP
jgi:DNA repair protein RecN (Recombination protein N)